MKNWNGVILALAIVLAACIVAHGNMDDWVDAVSIPNTFSNGTTADATEVNANFAALKSAVDTLQSQMNGSFNTYKTSANTITNVGPNTTGSVVSPSCNTGDQITGCWCDSNDSDCQLYDVQPETSSNTCDCKYKNTNTSGTDDCDVKAAAVCLALP